MEFDEEIIEIIEYFYPFIEKFLKQISIEYNDKKYSKLDSEMTNLIILNEKIKKDLINEKIKNSLLEKKIDDLNLKISNLEILDNKNLIDHKTNQEKKLLDIIMRKNNEHKELKDQIYILNNRIYELNNQIERLSSENINLQSQNNEFKIEINQLKLGKISLENILKSPDGIEIIKNDKVNQENLEKELREKEKKLSDFEKKIKADEIEIQFYKSKFIKL